MASGFSRWLELARKKMRSVAEQNGGGKNERSVVVQVFVVFGGGFACGVCMLVAGEDQIGEE